jgi:hypothetical protein
MGKDIADKLREVKRTLERVGCLCLTEHEMGMDEGSDTVIAETCARCRALADFPDPDALEKAWKAYEHIAEMMDDEYPGESATLSPRAAVIRLRRELEETRAALAAMAQVDPDAVGKRIAELEKELRIEKAVIAAQKAEIYSLQHGVTLAEARAVLANLEGKPLPETSDFSGPRREHEDES